MEKANFYKLLGNNLLLNSDTLPELRLLTDRYPCFHAAWMLLLKNLQQTGDKDLENSIRRTAIRIPDRKILYNYLFANQKDEAAGYYIEQPEIILTSFDDEEQESEGNELIEKFLSGSAGHIKIDTDFRAESDRNEVISKSLAESDELITETLANIFVEQKKYDKALDAFKKLSLKYPEKSVYFAARIEETEKYLK